MNLENFLLTYNWSLQLTIKISKKDQESSKSLLIRSFKKNVRKNKDLNLIKKKLISINSLTNENLTSVKNLMSLSYIKIDKAIQKGIIHSNNGNSKKSSLAKAFKKHETNLR